MDAKLFEIRDKMTFIPALAVRCNPQNEAERFLLSRAGFGITPSQQGDYILLTNNISGGDLLKMNCDPNAWGGADRTYSTAHRFITENWDKLETGAVVDVEHILGERPTPKISERHESITGF